MRIKKIKGQIKEELWNSITFKKSKIPIMKIAFWLILFSSIFLLFAKSLSFPYQEIARYSAPLEEVAINLTFDKPQSLSLFACYNDYCNSYSSDIYSNVYSSRFDHKTKGFFENKINTLSLVYEKKYEKIIENNLLNINLHIGTKDYYIEKDEFSKFDKKNLKIKIDNSKDEKLSEVKDFSSLVFPKKYSDNYKGVFSNLCTLFLSWFYNSNNYILSYFYLFLAFLIYLFNKDSVFKEFEFEKKIFSKIKISASKLCKNKKTAPILFFIILLIAIILRMDLFNYYPLWPDEIYIKTTAIESFKSCFQDPGNPPLFNILEFLMSKIFGLNDFVLRILPFLFSLGSVCFTYLIFKKLDENSEKNALNCSLLAFFAMFFVSINTINIYHSTEIRSYSMAMFLVSAMVFYLFDYLKNPKIKPLIIYAFFLFCALNTHFNLAFFGLCAFVWGFAALIDKKKDIKTVFSFVVANFTAFLGFLPYLIYTLHSSLDADFNGWIEPISFNTFKYIINEYFINKWVFLIFSIIIIVFVLVSLLPEKIKLEKILSKFKFERNKEKENFFMFLVFSIVFSIVLMALISLFVKPMLHKRLLLALYQLLMFLEIMVISSIFSNKNDEEMSQRENEFIGDKFARAFKIFYFSIFAFLCFAITSPMPLKNIYRVEPFMNFVANDAKYYHNKGYKIVAIISSPLKYLDNFEELKTLDFIDWHRIDTYKGSHLVRFNKKDYIKDDKKTVVYISGLAGNIDSISDLNPRAYLYTTTSQTRYLKLIYE